MYAVTVSQALVLAISQGCFIGPVFFQQYTLYMYNVDEDCTCMCEKIGFN